MRCGRRQLGEQEGPPPWSEADNSPEAAPNQARQPYAAPCIPDMSKTIACSTAEATARVAWRLVLPTPGRSREHLRARSVFRRPASRRGAQPDRSGERSISLVLAEYDALERAASRCLSTSRHRPFRHGPLAGSAPWSRDVVLDLLYAEGSSCSLVFPTPAICARPGFFDHVDRLVRQALRSWM